MKQTNSMREFYSSLKDISAINSNLDEKRKKLEYEVYEFNTQIQKEKIDKNIIKQNKEMAELLERTISRIKESSAFWVENFKDMQEQEKLNSELANYFIIIIFGKVKAGKSSLGNFIAEQKQEQQAVQFFTYDKAGKKQTIAKLEEVDDNRFGTDNLECTNEIQGFKLDGLAWIDTPGLGSMVKENGDLAKRYIEAAHYIIYPTSSDATMDMSEKAQLLELFDQNKKVTICITKSDTKEEDECICGSEVGCVDCVEGITSILKNKTIQNRQEQEKHVKDTVKEIMPKNRESILGDIFSISTYTAKKGLQDDDMELFENSNMSRFYEQITKVIKEKATSLKQEAPYDGLKSFIENNILGYNNSTQKNSVANIEKALKSLDKKIDESLKKFKALQNNANHDIESEIEHIVSKHESRIEQSNFKEVISQIDTELNTQISKVVQDNIQEIFADLDATLQDFANSFHADSFEIKDKHKTIEYSTTKRNKIIGASILGAASTIGAGFALASNPVGWVIAGSIFAGYVGSKIGADIGEITGSMEKESIKAGDNKEEVIQKFKKVRLDEYEKYAKELYRQMRDEFFIPLQNSSQDMGLNISRFKENLKNLL